MRITAIHSAVVPIASAIRNAYIDFSKMTLSLVAVVTDVIRDGKPVVGYGFNSNGRYGQGGLMRERFIAAHPGGRARQRCSTSAGDNLDPHKIWATMMTNEKPGGHGERSVAIGTIDMAVWDAVAKIEGKPLFRLLAERYGDGNADRKVFVYAAGGYYYPGKDDEQLQDEMRSYLDRGYTVVKMKIGGAPLAEDLPAHRGGAAGDRATAQRLRVDANGRFDLETAHRLRQGAARRTACSGTRRPAIRSTTRCRPSWPNHYRQPMATGENLFSHAGRAQPDPLRRHAPRSRLAAVRLRAVATAWSNTCARWTC